MQNMTGFFACHVASQKSKLIMYHPKELNPRILFHDEKNLFRAVHDEEL